VPIAIELNRDGLSILSMSHVVFGEAASTLRGDG
jgi:hypothetical protein